VRHSQSKASELIDTILLFNIVMTAYRNYTGPQKASPDHKGSSQRNYRSGPYSPGFEFDEDSHSKYMSDHSRSKMMNDRDLEDSEVHT
jgi:hypothetical protein